MDTGCIFAGHLGQYIYDEIIILAVNEGWRDADPDGKKKYLRESEDFDFEYLIETSDEAIDYLNDNVAEDGNSFGWYEGEFFYQSLDWWKEMSDG